MGMTTTTSSPLSFQRASRTTLQGAHNYFARGSEFDTSEHELIQR